MSKIFYLCNACLIYAKIIPDKDICVYIGIYVPIHTQTYIYIFKIYKVKYIYVCVYICVCMHEFTRRTYRLVVNYNEMVNVCLIKMKAPEEDIILKLEIDAYRKFLTIIRAKDGICRIERETERLRQKQT